MVLRVVAIIAQHWQPRQAGPRRRTRWSSLGRRARTAPEALARKGDEPVVVAVVAGEPGTERALDWVAVGAAELEGGLTEGAPHRSPTEGRRAETPFRGRSEAGGLTGGAAHRSSWQGRRAETLFLSGSEAGGLAGGGPVAGRKAEVAALRADGRSCTRRLVADRSTSDGPCRCDHPSFLGVVPSQVIRALTASRGRALARAEGGPTAWRLATRSQ